MTLLSMYYSNVMNSDIDFDFFFGRLFGGC